MKPLPKLFFSDLWPPLYRYMSFIQHGIASYAAAAAGWFYQSNIWAATRQNQQNGCAPSKDSDQSGHPPSVISLRCALNGQLRTQTFFMRTAKTLIREGGCPGWSESSLGAQSLCWVCHVVVNFKIQLCLKSSSLRNLQSHFPLR